MQYKHTLLFLLLSISCFANKIDDVNSGSAAIDFIKSNFKGYSYLEIGDTSFFKYAFRKQIAKNLNLKYWVKEDFDKNGETDLMLYGKIKYQKHPFVLMIVMSFKKNLELIVMNLKDNDWGSSRYFPVVRKYKGVAIIELNQNPKIKYKSDVGQRVIIDNMNLYPTTYTYFFGKFIKYNPSPTNYTIDKLIYNGSPCFKKCSEYDIILHKNGQVYMHEKFNYTSNNQAQGKTVKMKIPTSYIDSINKLLNYIQLDQLEDNYSTNAANLPTANLSVYYNNKLKTINDYGLQGTPGLECLYNLLHKLSSRKGWEEWKPEEAADIKLWDGSTVDSIKVVENIRDRGQYVAIPFKKKTLTVEEKNDFLQQSLSFKKQHPYKLPELYVTSNTGNYDRYKIVLYYASGKIFSANYDGAFLKYYPYLYFFTKKNLAKTYLKTLKK